MKLGVLKIQLKWMIQVYWLYPQMQFKRHASADLSWTLLWFGVWKWLCHAPITPTYLESLDPISLKNYNHTHDHIDNQRPRIRLRNTFHPRDFGGIEMGIQMSSIFTPPSSTPKEPYTECCRCKELIKRICASIASHPMHGVGNIFLSPSGNRDRWEAYRGARNRAAKLEGQIVIILDTRN
jgi:hypothetical protein